MKKIVIFGGTAEGRELTERLAGKGLSLCVCVATEYGAAFVLQSDKVHVKTGRMNAEEMQSFLAETDPCCCVDATHPYAAEVSDNVRLACQKTKLPLLRIERRTENGTLASSEDGERVYICDSIEEAAEFLASVEGGVLVTTGSKELDKYTTVPDYKNRLTVRVIPAENVMERCRALGFEGKHVIGMQGPFSAELNYEMLRSVGAKWMVTKCTGREGGYPEKCEACARADAGLVVVRKQESKNADEAAEQKAGASSAVYTVCETVAQAAEWVFGYAGGSRTDERIQHDSMQTEDVQMQQEQTQTEDVRMQQEQTQTEDVQMQQEQTQTEDVQTWKDELSRTIYLIGAGPGERALLTEEAAQAIEVCELLIGAERLLKGLDARHKKEHYINYKAEEIINYIDTHGQYRKIGILFSGDIGFYSGAAAFALLFTNKKKQPYALRRIPGISAPLYMMDKLGISWQDTTLLSCHGREQNIIGYIRTGKRVCTLLGGVDDVSRLCEKLIDYGMEHVKVTVGERLSYEDERIVSGEPKRFVGQSFDTLAVALFENDKPVMRSTDGIADGEFIRGAVPMTKGEVRALSIAKLAADVDSVIYDIGAGTGSVSVELALFARDGLVYAVEKNKEALALIRENKKKFAADNLVVTEGCAPQILSELPAPSHVFIGGSGGSLTEIIEAVRAKNQRARFVVNAVTVETVAKLSALAEKYPEYADMELLHVQVSRSTLRGSHHFMTAENGIYIAAFGGKQED